MTDETPAGSPCRICDPARGPNVWAMNEGVACDDGRYCTISDASARGGLGLSTRDQHAELDLIQ